MVQDNDALGVLAYVFLSDLVEWHVRDLFEDTRGDLELCGAQNHLWVVSGWFLLPFCPALFLMTSSSSFGSTSWIFWDALVGLGFAVLPGPVGSEKLLDLGSSDHLEDMVCSGVQCMVWDSMVSKECL